MISSFGRQAKSASTNVSPFNSYASHLMKIPVARGLAPVGLRSGPKTMRPVVSGTTAQAGFMTAAQPNGGKPPRHSKPTHLSKPPRHSKRHRHSKLSRHKAAAA